MKTAEELTKEILIDCKIVPEDVHSNDPEFIPYIASKIREFAQDQVDCAIKRAALICNE